MTAGLFNVFLVSGGRGGCGGLERGEIVGWQGRAGGHIAGVGHVDNLAREEHACGEAVEAQDFRGHCVPFQGDLLDCLVLELDLVLDCSNWLFL